MSKREMPGPNEMYEGFIKARMKRNAFYKIGPMEEGLLVRMGQVIGRLEPGLHYKFPLVDEVVIVDKRPKEYFKAVSIETKEASTGGPHQLEAEAGIIYMAEDAQKIYINAPENPREQIDKFIGGLTKRFGFRDITYDTLLHDRHKLEKKVESALREFTSPWGINIDKFFFSVLDPIPEQIEQQRKMKEVELKQRVAIIEASTRAQVYTIEKEAQIDAELKRLKGKANILNELISGWSDKFGRENALYIVLQLLGGHGKSPVDLMLQQEFTDRGEARGIQYTSKQLGVDTKTLAVLETLKNAQGALIVDAKHFPDLEGPSTPKKLSELDQELAKKAPRAID